MSSYDFKTTISALVDEDSLMHLAYRNMSPYETEIIVGYEIDFLYLGSPFVVKSSEKVMLTLDPNNYRTFDSSDESNPRTMDPDVDPNIEPEGNDSGFVSPTRVVERWSKIPGSACLTDFECQYGYCFADKLVCASESEVEL